MNNNNANLKFKKDDILPGHLDIDNIQRDENGKKINLDEIDFIKPNLNHSKTIIEKKKTPIVDKKKDKNKLLKDRKFKDKNKKKFGNHDRKKRDRKKKNQGMF